MNHDYAHCMDYSPDCPMECFRARLTKEALDKYYTIVSFMHFENTEECKREESKYDNRSIKRSSRGSSKDGYEH